MRLDYTLNRTFIETVYASLKLMEKEQMHAYEPGFEKEIVFDITNFFVKCWRAYFFKLQPILVKKYKKDTIKQINIIFANEIYNIGPELYKNTTIARMALYNIEKNLINYEKNKI